jgi:EAL domain-containing protein (putative c-di-GMP-specific phosphodiesterase class I)
MMGAEVLVRWQHPHLGLITTNNFIPIAEESHLIIDIGDWVIQTACAQAKKWQQMGHPHFAISVDLSHKQLLNRDFVRRISIDAQRTGLAAHALQFEIMENLLLDIEPSILEALYQLKENGLNLSINHFGAGYCSLRSLSQLPIDSIKIDRSFLSPSDPNNARLLRAMIGLGHALNLKISIEGIETLAQLAAVKEAGCEIGQGYLLSRPLPVNELTELILHPPNSFLLPNSFSGERGRRSRPAGKLQRATRDPFLLKSE